MSNALFLFDVDGTLVDAGGAGKRALSRMFEQMAGVPEAFRNYNFSGKTDQQIIRDAWQVWLSRDPTPEEVEQARRGYIALLLEEMARPGYRSRVLPGVRTLLETLRSLSVPTGLSTGNIEEGAHIKLAAVDLWHFFPFGGFGSDSADRAELTALGARRGRTLTGKNIPDHRVFVVGDSPLDVDAAHRAGFVSVAVMTGWSTRDEILAKRPEFLFDDLSDTPTLLDALDVK